MLDKVHHLNAALLVGKGRYLNFGAAFWQQGLNFVGPFDEAQLARVEVFF